MTQVQTARGPIDSSRLGRVLIHEHVFLMDMEYTYNYRPDFFEDETVTKAADRLNALKAVGIDTINLARRATFVIDGDGRICWIGVSPHQREAPTVQQILSAIEACGKY